MEIMKRTMAWRALIYQNYTKNIWEISEYQFDTISFYFIQSEKKANAAIEKNEFVWHAYSF